MESARTLGFLTLSIRFSLLLFLFLLVSECQRSDERRIRILTAGLSHESDTFCPIQTEEKDFTVARGEEALKGKEWAQFLQKAGVELIPTLHAGASPFGVVSRRTYEKFKGEILDGVRKAGPVDGMYLAMHGALHAEGYEDAQADLVRFLREILGEQAVIAASFDLHGNISEEFAQGLNIMTALRTAPHVDGVETQARAVRLLLEALQKRQKPVPVLVKVPILIPGEKGITGVEPLKSIYGQLPSVSQKKGLLDASIFVGMAWSDVPRASMSVTVVADGEKNRKQALSEAKRLAALLWEKRSELKFDVPTDTIDGAIATALQAPEKTVFITDSGDNITAGAAGDNPFVLERLLAKGVRNAVVAGIVDAAAVETCERAGVGGQIKLRLGGKLDTVFGKPLEVEGTVRSLVPSGPPKGKAAVLDLNGILVVLLNLRRSFTSPKDFQEVGIDPLGHKIVVVKLGYLFQALRDIAPRTIMALTPGFSYQVVEELPYRNVRRPIYPLDPGMAWSP
jgi:microcystin degradation protein MlrC